MSWVNCRGVGIGCWDELAGRFQHLDMVRKDRGVSVWIEASDARGFEQATNNLYSAKYPDYCLPIVLC